MSLVELLWGCWKEIWAAFSAAKDSKKLTHYLDVTDLITGSRIQLRAQPVLVFFPASLQTLTSSPC